MKDDWLLIGRISAAHGIRGWVKVYSYTDPMEQIIDYSPWLLRRQRRVNGKTDPSTSSQRVSEQEKKQEQVEERQVEVVEGRRQGKGVAVRLSGFEDRNEAETLIGLDIWVSRDRLPQLEPGEYYWHQLEDLVVVNGKGVTLGKVGAIMDTGGRDVLEVVPTPGSVDDQVRLIPYVPDQIVSEVNLQAGLLRVDWDADY
ncbi:MAG: ribosome maturation factor RimM [Proteobacteria bacterium]|nr:ribosome maturation factor RimM [Pseudomonadota bacterium]MDA1300630.1 ribosome maturation factor RimM [Pseudomonadota bacterium]